MNHKKTLTVSQQSLLQQLIDDHEPLHVIYQTLGYSEGTVKRFIKEYHIDMSHYDINKNRRMAHQRQLTNEEIKIIQKQLQTPGYSKHQIARDLGMTYATLCLKIKEYNINDQMYCRPGNCKKFSSKQKQKIKYMLDAGKTYTEIGQILGLNRNSLAQLIDLGGIEGHSSKPKRELTDTDKEILRLMQEENISIQSMSKIINRPISRVKRELQNYQEKEETLQGILNAINIYCNYATFQTDYNVITEDHYEFIKDNIYNFPFVELQERLNVSRMALHKLILVKFSSKVYALSKLKTCNFFEELKQDCMDPTKNLTQLSIKYNIGSHTMKKIRNSFGNIDTRRANYLMLSKAEMDCEEVLKGLDLAYIYQKQIGPYKVDYYLGSHIVIEVQGDYFHKYREDRDIRKKTYLEQNGYNILYVWEHDLEHDQESVAEAISSAYRKAFLDK